MREDELFMSERVNEAVNAVLEQIRAEIEKIPTDYCGGYIGLDKKEVLQIIDKYK